MNNPMENFVHADISCNLNNVPSAIELVESESRQHPDNGVVIPPIKPGVNKNGIFSFERKMEDTRSKNGIISISAK